MKRNYISPEYKYTNVDGTFNMTEQRAIFGSKMMEIDDEILLDNRDIVYYHNVINEQLDLTQERLLSPVIYSITQDKKSSHSISIDNSQSDFEKQKNTKWVLEINTRDILVNYIFSKIKESRAFENVKNSSTSSNSIDIAIRKYIEFNLLSRYKYTEITLYVKYNSLRGSGFYRYENKWNQNIAQVANKHSKLQVDLNFDKSKMTVRFTQEKVATDYNFDYYFDIKYVKI